MDNEVRIIGRSGTHQELAAKIQSHQEARKSNPMNTHTDTKQTARRKPEFANHKAADFMNASGEHILSLQLLNENRHAIAIADFRSGKLERFDCASAVINQAKDWLSQTRKLYTS